jgi:Mn2+/Fe2+ NRAMP family transporter
MGDTRSEDIRTVEAAGEVLAGRSQKGRLARLLPFLGPAFIASVAYVDPGNFATNIQGGAKFGLPFAIIPLVLFTRRRDVMGVLVNRRVTTLAASVVAVLIIVLNLYLLYQTFLGG